MEQIAHKFRVLKNLGSGAMGEVYLVMPPKGDPVALKLLKTSENQKAAIEQFENEFKVLKKLSHPNIGRIFDFGFDDESQKVFFTSPWLKGCDLFAATNNLSFEKCEDMFVQVLRAVNYLHQKGIIHCDLKPGNIYVENGNQVVLIDFGLAGYWGASIVGTPTYLAPEIFRGEKHSITSDLYAIGVIFYNCLTRIQPFSGKSLQEVYDRHRTHTPTPPVLVNDKIPKYMNDIIMTLLSKKPEERYSSAAAVIEDIAAFSKRKYTVETKETLLSYLPTTSELIGRQDAQLMIDQTVAHFVGGRSGKAFHVMYLYGENGVGKSKFISQIRTSLQLEKISIEDVKLPLGEADKKLLKSVDSIILEDLEDFLDEPEDQKHALRTAIVTAEHKKSLFEFVSFLEQKILSPDTKRMLVVICGTTHGQFRFFEPIFPHDDSEISVVEIKPFDENETRIFLETIIASREIPDLFVSEIYRDTGGNPQLCEQIIKNMIERGLLFDEKGRWSSDLLANLSEALKKVETSQSLEERLTHEYQNFSKEEKEIVHWLAVSPHGLTPKALERLSPGFSILQKKMMDKKIIRFEDKKTYFLYRSAYIPFISKSLPSSQIKELHRRLSQNDLGLNEQDIWYHQSLGGDSLMVLTALEQLGDALAHEGKKERALECYEKLHNTFVDVPLPQRVEWAVAASEILIWLDRFPEAVAILGTVEKEMTYTTVEIPLKSRLKVWEKKGLALLHQQSFKEAGFYFTEGLKISQQSGEAKVEEIRFLNDLAQIDMVTGQLSRAVNKFSEARIKSKSLSKNEIKRVTNNDLGHVYYRMQDFENAIEILKEDVKIFSTLPYLEPLARAQYTLAECYRAVKKLSKAISEYERCIEICNKENLLSILLRAYNGLGNVYLVSEKYPDALKNYQRALEISVHLNDLTTKAALLVNQGLIYRYQNNLPQATRRFLLAKQILESKDKKLPYETQLLSKCLSELSQIAMEENNSMRALTFQVEKAKMMEDNDTLKSDEFPIKLELARLYLENRLEEPFKEELLKLEELAHTDDEKQQIAELKARLVDIRSYSQDNTLKVGEA
ncbi:tetratricopeptide repeat protein [bacterium]|nr:tetratricopeptide repeat protein [bacterium]